MAKKKAAKKKAQAKTRAPAARKKKAAKKKPAKKNPKSRSATKTVRGATETKGRGATKTRAAKAKAQPPATPADRHREAAARYSRGSYNAVSDIGPPPKRNEELYERYRYNLRLCLEECFPESTGLSPFSPSHVAAIEATQNTILHGGRRLRVVFRGWAKSTILENASIWAAGYGWQDFILYIGADADSVNASIESIKAEVEFNDHLMKIFPEWCHCVRALEGKTQRTASQTIGRERTLMTWRASDMQLPTVKGFAGSGCVIRCKGIEGAVRGARQKLPDGRQVRPGFVPVDDPQTDESAASVTQTESRLKTLTKSLLQLGGHQTKKIAMIVNATIIEPDDMIDRLADPKQFPGWETEKVPMLLSFAEKSAHENEWLGEYAKRLLNYDADVVGSREAAIADATAYYKKRRKKMDAGAEASWEHCYDDEEISAVQHAYNKLILDGEDVFQAEYQNNPVRETAGLRMLPQDEILQKQWTHERGRVPAGCEVLTTHVDVHPTIHYWHVWAWRPDGTGFLVDDGTFPEQPRRDFSHNRLRRTLTKAYAAELGHEVDEDSAVAWGLREIIQRLFTREFLDEDNVPRRLKRMLIDANGEVRDTVFDVIRTSPYAAMISPSFGHFVHANSKPMSTWEAARKKDVGPDWVPTKKTPSEPPGYIFDSNAWKTRFHRKLALPEGARGALYLYKHPDPRHFTPQAASFWTELPRQVVGARDVFEWKLRKKGLPNHPFDSCVGALVAASIEGVGREPRRRGKRKLSDLQKEKQRRRAG